MRVPGGRFDVTGVADWFRATAAAAELLGPAAWWAVRQAQRRPAARHAAADRWAERCRRRLRIELAVRGDQHIDPAIGYIVVALHESFADVLALLSLPVRLDVAARGELREWRTLGRWLSATNAPVVDPEHPVAAYRALVRHTESIDPGVSLLVFPQGSILGVETAFHRGAFALADRLDRPVLPVVVAGGHRVWEHPFSPRLRFGCAMWMEVLPPLPVGGALEMMPIIEREMKQRALSQTFAPVRHFVPERDGWWDGYAYEIDPTYQDLAIAVAQRRGRMIEP
jgi:1-acyl-sn-glycerol-3-phosphate acyltransferase